ncbi:MFS transporter [Cohnella endophytica]|uniref:MFS transporter n=1 Tax=Cohnella endophytica TaxID=2419778 RepID=A0A494XRZ1_9BACL|nr:MFS transporter [Cohnella endophytica]RKP51626.1 MFS transporter [Cohnella endophytica]
MNQRNDTATGRLDGQMRLLLAVNGLFVTASALSGTFIGVYLWKASKDFVLLGAFTLLTHFLMAATFWLAGKGVKEGNKMVYFRSGIGVSALFYAAVLLLGSNAIHYIALLGIVQGIANGLFWLGFNVIYFEVTDAANRDRFNGLAGVVGSVVGMLAPWCSGYVISRMSGETGYRMIFMISLGLFVAGIAVSFFLRNRKTEGSYDWRLPARIWIGPRTPWRPVFCALAAQGLRESVFGLMIGLLVYIQTGSEMKLGNFALITSGAGFVSFYATGRWLKPKWRPRGMLVGTIALTAMILPLFLGVSFAALLVFGIGTALFLPLYFIPMTSAVFDLIGMDDNSARHRVEYVVLRELGLNAGRIIGMLAFIAIISVSRAPIVMTWTLFAIGSSPIISWLFMRGRLTFRHSPS